MSDDLATVLRRQRERLQSERVQLAQEIEQIDQEIADLDAAERVLTKYAPDVAQGELEMASAEDHTPPGKTPFPGTKKNLVLAILELAYPLGLKAELIHESARILFFSTINSNTLTVSLGRLRAEMKVRNEGRTWFFVPPRTGGIKKGARPEQPGEASNSEGAM